MKGEMTLKQIMILLLVLLVLIPIFQYMKLIPELFAKDLTIPEQDMNRVIDNLNTLSNNDLIEVYANGYDYQIALYTSQESPKICQDKACICVKEGLKAPSCEIIWTMEEQCSQNKPCIKQSTVYEVTVKTGRSMIPLCSKNNNIKMGDECYETNEEA